jgi:hypothetical protein
MQPCDLLTKKQSTTTSRASLGSLSRAAMIACVRQSLASQRCPALLRLLHTQLCFYRKSQSQKTFCKGQNETSSGVGSTHGEHSTLSNASKKKTHDNALGIRVQHELITHSLRACYKELLFSVELTLHEQSCSTGCCSQHCDHYQVEGFCSKRFGY